MKVIIETLETLSKKKLIDVTYDELLDLCALLVENDGDSIFEGILPTFIEEKYVALANESISECYGDVFDS